MSSTNENGIEMEGIEDVSISELTEKSQGDNCKTIKEKGENFDFSEWIIQCGLKRNTAAILRKEDLTSMDSLMLLEESDLVHLGLTMGQRKLLSAALSKMRQEKSELHKSCTSQINISKSFSDTANLTGTIGGVIIICWNSPLYPVR